MKFEREIGTASCMKQSIFLKHFIKITKIRGCDGCDQTSISKKKFGAGAKLRIVAYAGGVFKW